MPNKLFLALILFFLASDLTGLEVQRGKIKLQVNEKSGRFLVLGAEDQVKPVWTALFSSDDLTTSKWKIQVAEKVSVLGDDPSFATSVEVTPTGAKTVWKSKALVVTLTYDFLISANSAVADGLRLLLSVVNVSEIPLKVGVRWVLDTSLGEKKDHFKTSAGDVYNVETKLEAPLEDWWVSAPATDDQPGLLVMTGKGASAPSRIYFSNWKRLDDAAWEPAYRQGRDFNQLPYSFNDSAVAQFYDPQTLAAGSTREVSILLGLRSARTFEGSRVGSANPLDDLLKKNQNPALNALDQDLVSLQTLLAQIDAKLSDPSRVSPEDLKLLQAVLDRMEGKRKALEGTKP